MKVVIKRIYDEYDPDDGLRILVDRLWPRGIKKSNAHVDRWEKEIAPSTELRKWFSHDPEKWVTFSKKYKEEIVGSEALKTFAASLKGEKKVTLLYAAKDEAHTHALVLQEVLKRGA